MISLPIDAIRADFETLLLTPAHPIVVEAPTGSGKSTRLPLWMAETLDGVILVIEPRRVACRSLASFLAEQRGERVGQSIGYQVRFDVQKSTETRVLFATPGMVLRFLQSENEWPFAAVLLDEFHERSWELDLIVAILRERRAKQGATEPLVVTSATLEAKTLVEAMDGRLLSSKGRTYPVEILEEDGTHLPSRSELEERLQKAVQWAVKKTGDILIFLPGVREIEQARQAIAGIAKQHSITVVPVHGRLPLEKLSKALQPNTSQRRLFLSTNVAETSVTLPGVRVVIDTGLVKRRIHRAGRSVLALVPVSRAEAEQRSGRAGRVAEGCCRRLWGKQAALQQETPAEIERIELDELLLGAGACGLSLTENLPWLVPPPSFAWQRAAERLQKWGAIDESGELTTEGKQFFQLPVTVEEARMVVNAPPRLLPTLIELCALLQLRRDLFRSLQGFSQEMREEIREAREELLRGATDEVMISLRLLRAGDARKHGLDRQVLNEARQIATALRKTLKAPKEGVEKLPSPEELCAFLMERIPEQVFVLRKRAQQPQKKKNRSTSTAQPWANREGVELHVHPYHVPYELRDKPKAPLAGILFSHQWVGAKGTRIQGFGHMLLPCSLKLLSRAGLGEIEVQEPRAFKRDGEWRVVGKVQQLFAGIALDTEEQELEGDSLRSTFAELVQKRQCWPAIFDLLQETHHLASILRQWPSPRSWTFPDEWKSGLPEPFSWLVQRLEELGVETNEELGLLELEDFHWPLLEQVEIDPMELESLKEDFPRLWEYQGAVYECHVEPRKRQVTMEPYNHHAKKAKQPPAARLLPRFRGFSIDFRKASRQFKLR